MLLSGASEAGGADLLFPSAVGGGLVTGTTLVFFASSIIHWAQGTSLPGLPGFPQAPQRAVGSRSGDLPGLG